MTVETRRSSRTERRRRRTARRASLRAIAVLAALGLAAGVPIALTRESDGHRTGPVGTVAEGDQVSYLLVLTDPADLAQQADGLTLFAIDRSGDRPVVLFIPTTVFGIIPGQGFEAVGKAMSVGRAPLQAITVANLLGVAIDHTVAVDREMLAGIVDALGGVVMEVREKLVRPDAIGRLVPAFPTGRVAFNGRNAVRFLTFRGEGENELDAFVRGQRFWEALLGGARAKPALFRKAMSSVEEGALDATAGEVAEFFAALAAAEERTYRVLPVEPVGAGGSAEAYAVDEKALTDMVGRLFAASRPAPGAGVGARVEILNGNGQPEVGALVAEELVPAGMRIVVSGNARSFDFGKTLIVVYADDAAAHALARRVRSLLGIGEIQIGRRAQTIVDVTVVVGRDFASSSRR